MLMELALNHLWREKKTTEFRIMAIALFIAVFAVTSITCLTSALNTQLSSEASTLMGADLILESPDPLPLKYQEYAISQKIRSVNVVDFFSMIIAKDNMQLASISAIDSTFPLRGKLLVQTQDNQDIVYGPPPPGHIWLEESLALKLKVVLNDTVLVGNSSLIFSGMIKVRPVAVSENSTLASIAYVNAKDLVTMGVLQPGSRATYRFLLAGTKEQINEIQTYFNNSQDVSWVMPTKGRQALQKTLIYSQRYLAIILIVQVFLAGIAVAICAHQYSLRQQKSVALWRTFGASGRVVIQTHLLSLFLLAIFDGIFSIGAGYISAHIIMRYGQQFGVPFSTLDWHGGLLGALTGIIILLGFALPPLLELKRVSPKEILSSQQIVLPSFSLLSFVLAILALGGLLFLFVGEADIALTLSAQILLMSVLAFSFAFLLWGGFQYLSQKCGLSIRFGLGYMLRHKWNSMTQWLVFTLVGMLLIFIHIVQNDLINLWRSQLPISTPNYFLINIQPSQIEALSNWFDDKGIKAVQFYPIVRGRMSHINGKSIEENNKKNNLHQGLQRPINLTWMTTLPKDNQVVSGINWEKIQPGNASVSVEAEFANRQGLKLGDTIGFQVADQYIEGTIVQFRKVEWESFKPNFFVIFAPLVIDQFPHSYITSLYLSPSQKTVLSSLIKEYSEISVIDIDAFLVKIRQMVDKISISLQILIMMVFVMGIMIMYASLLSSIKERLLESAMLQILGAKKQFIAKVLMVEFGVLGFTSGLIASLMAMIVAQDIAQRFFNIHLYFQVFWVGVGTVISTMVVILFGLIGARSVFRVSPLWLLRQSA